jgi:predicted MPP superfamily phosphohydrolase
MSSDRIIAHLSDLHWIKGKKWESKFNFLKNALVEQCPELIFITGDCVDTPFWQSNFVKLGERLDELYLAINTAHKEKQGGEQSSKKPYIYTVPGNHDCFLKGNQIQIIAKNIPTFTSWRNHYKNNFLKCLVKPSGAQDEGILLDEIYKETNVAIFSIDSNAKSRSWWTAQGRIDEPETRITEIATRYKAVALGCKRNYNDAVKIALVHHHPLPIPYANQADVRVEEHLILENSYNFLSSAVHHGINLVFHGHRHTHGTSGFIMLDQPDYPLIVSSCGSSCNLKTENSLFKIVKISKSGKCDMKSFLMQGDDAFKHDSASSATLVGYDHIRKLRYKDHSRFLDTSFSHVDMVKKKTKIVEISQLGTGRVYISHDKVTWKKGSDNNRLVMREKLRGFNGRIPGVVRKLSNSAHDKFEEHSYFPKPQVEWNSKLASEPEEYSVDMTAEPGTVMADPAWGKMLYYIFNGYAISRRHHSEMYQEAEGDAREEISTISVDYPTERLELRVIFENGDTTFPDPGKVNYMAIPINNNSAPPSDLEILHAKIKDYDNEEEEYLRGVGALEVNKTRSEISLSIQYPQPGYLYVLRWSVRSIYDRVKLGGSDKGKFENIRGELLNKESDKLKKIYGVLETALNGSGLFTDRNLEYVILGYDSVAKHLVSQHINYET